MKTGLAVCLLLLPMAFAAYPQLNAGQLSSVVSGFGSNPYLQSSLHHVPNQRVLDAMDVASWADTHLDAAFLQQAPGPSQPGRSLPLPPKAPPGNIPARDSAFSLSELTGKLAPFDSPQTGGVVRPPYVMGGASARKGGAFPMTDVGVSSPMGMLSPVNVGADFTLYGNGGQGQGQNNGNPDSFGGPPTADNLPVVPRPGPQLDSQQQLQAQNHVPADSPATPTQRAQHSKPAGTAVMTQAQQQAKLARQQDTPSPPGQAKPAVAQPSPALSLQYSVQSDPNSTAEVQLNQSVPVPSPSALPTGEQVRRTNLFVMGLDRSDVVTQNIPDSASLAPSSSSGSVGGPRGLELVQSMPSSRSQPSAVPLATELRAPCDNLVDALFVLDDVSNVWLIRESVRHYQTHLLASPNARFGLVLCGSTQTFYTNLYNHFSAMLASLEDLQHANATLEPAEQMPDTPGYRADNNPYPPRVSEDFTLSSGGCLETVFQLLSYKSAGQPVERLVTVIATKERWGDPVALEEARFLRSRNFYLLTLADRQLSNRAQDTLRNMASSPDKFRFVNDNVTMHALPAMIGNAVCRPQKADVTVVVQRTETMKLQDAVISGCRQVNASTLERTTNFGRFFGNHVDLVTCTAGAVPDLQTCTCA